ncbi:hypothetical protein PVK06_002052 [Gossypium arboreum]|uniref:Uncharacterized protein n=1 Tax=Gossypium arboreum TaxID=29729 RepID=A0ABR0R3T1_GOSAR|nr:hypothetical protein PVK06_002052 [Gossypium arboreum]
MSLFEILQFHLAKEIAQAQQQHAEYWAYMRSMDLALKKSLQKNFTKPMPKFSIFAATLLPFTSATKEPTQVAAKAPTQLVVATPIQTAAK